MCRISNIECRTSKVNRWHVPCSIDRMRPNALDNLRVFQLGKQAAVAVSALIDETELRKDFNLRDQLRRASSSVPAQIAEGFGQVSDRHFASYLYMARGGCNEVRAHLDLARSRGLLSVDDHGRICELYEHEGRMLTRLIQHLEREDRTGKRGKRTTRR